MATQSRVIFEQDDNGDVAHHKRVTIFWDDVPNQQGDMPLTAVDADNRLGVYPLPISFTVLKNGRTFNVTVQPGERLQQNIGTGQAQRFDTFINPVNGRLDGIDYRMG